ncbi:hypothetical protein CEXT_132831 [Caerostris extrusa]|uniref:Uncharacterized protein n=1 Tax=Caerostris extrusa TaxID=172846 RepID=A0AAV4W9P5_CAEEX|nr:hypothetical protein CEXT_132831 [Caerostris extrusa]
MPRRHTVTGGASVSYAGTHPNSEALHRFNGGISNSKGPDVSSSSATIATCFGTTHVLTPTHISRLMFPPRREAATCHAEWKKIFDPSTPKQQKSVYA